MYTVVVHLRNCKYATRIRLLIIHLQTFYLENVCLQLFMGMSVHVDRSLKFLKKKARQKEKKICQSFLYEREKSSLFRFIPVLQVDLMQNMTLLEILTEKEIPDSQPKILFGVPRVSL